MDLDLIRRTAICVKALETAADEKDYVNFLTPARELSDNVVRLVTLATQFNLVEIAGELRERVKQAMAEAKTLLREKSDASLDRFKGLLRQVAKVLVSIMNELKQIKASGSLAHTAPPTSPSPVRSSLIFELASLFFSFPTNPKKKFLSFPTSNQVAPSSQVSPSTKLLLV